MILVGITGAIGHGKSSLAEALMKQQQPSVHLESSEVIMAVANVIHQQDTVPLPTDLTGINKWLEILPDILERTVRVRPDFSQIIISPESWHAHPEQYEKLVQHLQHLQQTPSLATQTINPDNKNQFRPVLQWLGGYLVQQVDAGIWYNELIRRALAAKADGYALVVIGGLRFRHDAEIVRSAGGVIIEVQRPDLAQADANDPTERERSSIQIDCRIINNGTLAALDKTASMLIKDIAKNRLQKEYVTLAV